MVENRRQQRDGRRHHQLGRRPSALHGERFRARHDGGGNPYRVSHSADWYYTLATNQVFDTLANLNGKLLSCLVHTANSAGCTLNVDGLGAFKLRNISGTDLSANQLYGNARVFFTFDNANSQFILLSLPGGILDAPAGTAMIFQQSSAPAG
jgi:hypothetical protein